MESKLLSALNESQREAVKNIEGPTMVIAGAGSGKTRVLTYRIAYMIEQGIDPFNILSLTFTNKAAEEMKERVINLLGNTKGRYVWMGTFHSIFSKVLRIEADYVGYTHNYIIYDTDDCKSLIKTILKELNCDDKIYKPGIVLTNISNAKSALILPEDYCNNYQIANDNKKKGMPLLSTIYSVYQSRLKKYDAMDFDDLLVNMYILLRDNPEILLKYQRKFRYILVDEYQDTNHVQYQIIRKLAAAYENICVVGDDAQSIYSFRGANITNILNFKENYPDCAEFKLEQNYRSTKNIIAAANSVIKNNRLQIPKQIWTDNKEGGKIKIVTTDSDIEESKYVAERIVHYKNSAQYDYNDFVILYRTNAQSRLFEEAMLRYGVPYRVYGGVSFYSRKEIKDMMAYYRLAVNFYDEEALRRIINYPTRGIGLTTMQTIMACANDNGVRIWDVIDNPAQYELNISSRAMNALQIFVNKIKSYHHQLQTLNACELGKWIAKDSGVEQELKIHTEEKERYDNLGELFNAMQNFVDRPAESRIDLQTGEDLQDAFPSLDLFLNEASLYTDADKRDEEGANKVKLMTIHAAKGLEFPCVFIVGVEENLMPSYMISTAEELEEERRLFYVAITRAKDMLTLINAETRRVFGNFNICKPSPFLKELDQKVVENEDVREKLLFPQQPLQKKEFFPSSNFVPESTQSKSVKKPIFSATILQKPTFPQSTPKSNNGEKDQLRLGEEFLSAQTAKIGMRVFHNTFGVGEVLAIDEENNRIDVNFEKFGKKRLMCNFAKLQEIL